MPPLVCIKGYYLYGCASADSSETFKIYVYGIVMAILSILFSKTWKENWHHYKMLPKLLKLSDMCIYTITHHKDYILRTMKQNSERIDYE